MQIIPAIDIINGKCVRLSKGDFNKQTIYHDDPVAMAKTFEDAGLQRLHMVDLDGAKKGTMQNLDVCKAVADATDLHIDFGGGVKNDKDIQDVFNAGARIVTLGSIAVKKPELVEEWVQEYGPQKILIGADVLDYKIKISGWLKDGGIGIYDFVHNMLAAGVTDIFCTDIAKDGMMQGVAIGLYENLLAKFPAMNLIASGGVTNISDVAELKRIGCVAAIIGKAIYEGAITLDQLSEENNKL